MKLRTESENSLQTNKILNIKGQELFMFLVRALQHQTAEHQSKGFKQNNRQFKDHLSVVGPCAYQLKGKV